MTALYVCSRAAAKKKVSILADGGIVKSGDIVKALTLSQAVICGGIFAGCNEAPGDVMENRRQTLQAIFVAWAASRR